ncbi:putative aminodeoxychorismate lyase [Megamonas hypermegale]|uniref:Endolytic murein transglycosylase n=1 Tax=Megamonas hypermegale TaxID=158847 RepID=A0A239TGX5_9FIRM|nr:endolytic transglycosylase MltG [Megamonas hypermegale]SNU96528.1 putative aminodeoxychorismate lyase [Megamonas hypermegale]
MWEKFASLSKKQRYIGSAIVALIIICIIFFALFGMGTSKGQGDNISVEISSGMTTAEIAETLKDKGVINSSTGFRILAKVGGYEADFKEGIYYFKSDMRVGVVLQNLVSGPQNAVVRVTIPEGYTVEDIATLMEKEGLVNKEDFCNVAKDFAPYDYMKEALDKPDINYAAEGFLFPDTYDFDRGYTAKQIMQIMADNFDRRVNAQMREKAKEENLSVFELITMASLVEKEAKFAEDRPIIANVFFKRLADGMMLQSDATIQYALDEHKEEFTIEDTKIDSPYNTYQHTGLTPGPIGNPGLDSINAVLNPADTDYLYFVADSEGHNHYSATYDEHLQTIKEVYGE